MGMKVKAAGMCELQGFVDADYAGLYGIDPSTDRSSAYSRTGYIIMLSNFPIVWKSVLQTETTLSTMHAEYVALSHCIKIMLPIKWMIADFLKVTSQSPTSHTAVNTTVLSATVFEDNAAALALALNHRLNHNTRYFNSKYHHFWEHVDSGEIKIQKIDTQEQRADYLTKGLTREAFERIRRFVQGW
jgi:hypothetical protein